VRKMNNVRTSGNGAVEPYLGTSRPRRTPGAERVSPNSTWKEAVLTERFAYCVAGSFTLRLGHGAAPLIGVRDAGGSDEGAER